MAGFDAHAAVGLQRGEGVDEGGVAQAAGVAELAACQRGRGQRWCADGTWPKSHSELLRARPDATLDELRAARRRPTMPASCTVNTNLR